MSNPSNQLEDIFQEVTDHFASIPAVTVQSGEGTPPEQYTITYNVAGVCKEDDGDVYTCDSHVISISLPFGFPHFPPNCLPESPTFHPDFDSSAICIGDAWEDSKSLVQLILHIGRMIAGEIHSEANAFNEEAAAWYKVNSERLPFGSADFSQSTAQEPALETQIDDLSSIDTLDDEDFGESFSLEDDQAPTIDTDRLKLMVKQKRFHSLARELKQTDEDFSARAELESDAQDAIAAGVKLFREAEKLEHKGKQKEALDKIIAVEEIVSDYPNLQEAKDRVQQAFELLGDWATDEQDSTPPTSEDIGRKQKSTERTFFEDKKAVSKKLLIAVVSIGGLALLVTVVLSYSSLSSSLEKAQSHYTECQNLLNQNNFHDAEQKCEDALGFATEVKMVKQSEKEQLIDKIKALQNLPKFKQGLAGNVMLDGKYVSVPTKELLLMFKDAKTYGDAFFEKKRWHESTLSYSKALAIAKETNSIDKQLLTETRARAGRAQFKELVLGGDKSLAGSDWQKAKEQYQKALTLAQTDPSILPEEITRLTHLTNQAEFNTARDQGHQMFKKGEWSDGLTNYTRALSLAEKLDVTDSTAISGLHENIARTKIYMAIEKGKKAFAISDWDEVIAQYEKAIILLKSNSALLSTINTEESGEKLSRIMLHAEIIQDKQDVAKHLKSKDYAAAVDKLQEIKQTISTSKFAEVAEFKTILDEVASQSSDTKKKLLIQKQSTYLVKNYKKLFLKHYPAASSSNLSAPRVEYLKNIGKKVLFRMQCTEKAGGRPLRLQMDYLYSPAHGSWKFHSEE